MTKHPDKLLFCDKLLFFVLGASLVLSIGFSMLRFPSWLPLTESLMLFCLLGYALKQPSACALWFRSPWFFFVLFWWFYVGITVYIAYPQWGTFAFRSATHAVEMAFILLGIWIGSTDRRKIWLRFFGIILLCGNIHLLFWPIAPFLRDYSPKVISLVGEETPIFFNYMNSALLTTSYLSWLLFNKDNEKKWNIKFAIVAMTCGYSLIHGQGRINYALYPLLFAMVFFLDHKKTKIFVGIILLFLLSVFIVSVYEIKLEGRIGTFNFEFLYHHFLASFGIIADPFQEGIVGSAAGVGQRLNWWSEIERQIFHGGITSLFFGLGQGIPLTDLTLADGTPVREPHNSVLSIIGRYGLLGLSVFLWMHILMARKLIRNIRASSTLTEYREYLILSFFLLSTFLIAMVEDALEKPFYAIWYYFVWGIAITRQSRQQKVYEKNSTVYSSSSTASAWCGHDGTIHSRQHSN